MRIRAPLLLSVASALVSWPLLAAAEPRVAVFDFELIDTSLDGAMYGVRPDETARLKKAGEQLRKALASSGRFEVADIGPVEAAAHAANLQACGGCDAALAQKAGASLAITGTVQKVSNLILNMNIYIRDASTKKLIAIRSADFRGNTDESWSRAVDYLIRNYLLLPNFGENSG
jgi:hypothetical protein